MKKILISTGGTGGHVLPALAFFEHFKKNFNVSIVTDQRGSKFIDKNQYHHDIIDVPNIFSNFIKLPINFILFFLSIIKSLKYLKNNRVDILLSTGGYMSIPLCLASKILNIRIYLFEPNMVIGRSNKFILKFSKKIICYQKNLIGLPKNYYNKVFLSKPILRKEIYFIEKNKNNKIIEPIKILILGGSQGASFFDDQIKNLIDKLSKKHNIIISQQISDKNKDLELKNFYKKRKIDYNLFRFNKNLFKNLNFYDLAISRSGASTISELAYLNIPFIAVPFPFAKDDHQFFNAKFYFDINCCWLVEQKDFSIDKVSDLISNLINNQKDYLNIKENLIKFSYQNTWNDINQKLNILK